MIDKKIAECAEIIRQGLSGILDAGFTFRKKNFEYTRKRGDCIDIYCVELYKWTGWYAVTPSVFIGCPRINRIYNTIHQRRDPLTGFTFGFGVTNRFDGQRGNYEILSEDDFRTAIGGVLADFHEVALPWFESIPDLAAVDAYMNAKSEWGHYAPQSVSYACKALIAAHVVGNPAFDELADAYYQFCCNAQSPELSKPILTTRDYLRAQA